VKKQKVGRPASGEIYKMKSFNLPVYLIKKMQKEADRQQGAKHGNGNLSLWLRNLLEGQFSRK